MASGEYYLNHREEILAAKKLEYHADPEKFREKTRSWRERNPGACKESKRLWMLANPEKGKEYSRRKYAKNPEKHKETMRRWAVNNPEKVRIIQRRWLENNRELHYKRSAQWAKDNPEKMREMRRRKYWENPEKARARARKWARNNQEKIKAARHGHYLKSYAKDPGSYKARARKRDADKIQATPKWADLQVIRDIYKNCPDGHHVDHIIPLRGKIVCGLHVETNLQYLTAEENMKKGNKLTAEAA